MKYLIAILIFFFAVDLFSINYAGDWGVATMGSGSKATISQEKNEISVLRILEQEFEGEKYLLFHLMKGDLNDKKFKLYVKEDKLEKFEYLRDVSFEKVNENILKLDGKKYKKIIKEDKIASSTLVDNQEDDGKVETIYLDKNSKKNNDVEVEIVYSDKAPKKEEMVKKEEETFMLPSGLGDKANHTINISSGFTSEEKALNRKAIRLMRKKNYKKAITIFLDLYKQDSKNISLLIKIENAYSIIGNKAKSKKYCKKIKKYDPFYPCGGW